MHMVGSLLHLEQNLNLMNELFNMKNIANYFAWNSLRSADCALNLPVAISDLENSTDLRVLDKAYWKIDNEAVVQGSLYQTALPVTICLLRLLSSCNRNSRVFIIELIEQFVAGEPAIGESKCLKESILQEVILYYADFTRMLASMTQRELDSCTCILVHCASHFPQFKNEIIEGMENGKNYYGDASIIRLIESRISEIKDTYTF